MKWFASAVIAMTFTACLASTGVAAEEPRDLPFVEVVGRAESFQRLRDWAGYYWRDDFTLTVKDDATGKTWRVISREPTPFQSYRMGPTYTELKVTWDAKPRVKIVGVAGIDRTPAEFHDMALDPGATLTAFVLSVDQGGDRWAEWYVNNWFHRWGAAADAKVAGLFAGREAPHDVYGWVHDAATPFDERGRAEIARHGAAKGCYHGLIRRRPDGGLEIELLHLFVRDPQTGGYKCVLGDPADLVPLDDKDPPK